SVGRVPVAVASGRHHSRARARACHRQGDGARAGAAERSSDGGQPLRPRRQGRAAGRRHLAGEEVTTTRWSRLFLHLSPVGRGRPRSERVRGPLAQSKRSVPSIISNTPSILSYTSVFDTRTIWNPQASSTAVRAASRLISKAAECVTPSTSTISFPWSVTK